MTGPLSGSIMLLLLLVAMASAVAPPSAPSPWMDTSNCPLTDSLMVCQLKKGMCSPINTIFSPPGGPVKAITTCANTTGATLGPQFFMSVGLTFLSGAPESLADKASSDPVTVTAIRRCALNATGLLNPDLLTINRTTVADNLSNAFISPELGAAVAAAVATCPEPVDYKLTDFIKCLKVACMDNVAVTPFMSQATSALTGAGAPAAAAAAVVAAKKPPAPKTAAPAAGAFPYAGGAAAGPASYMGGAFPFAGAGGASAGGAAAGSASFMGGFAGAGGAGGAAAGPASYMGGFAGAGGASAGGASAGGAAAGPASYMAGAFPFAGAGGAGGAGAAGAGAFTYPSSSGGAPAAPKTA